MRPVGWERVQRRLPRVDSSDKTGSQAKDSGNAVKMREEHQQRRHDM